MPVPYAEGGPDGAMTIPKDRPEVRQARMAGAEVDRLLAKLGLSPADRARLVVSAPSEDEGDLNTLTG